MNILILGGMHGNEPLGIEIVEMLQTAPIPSVTGVIANKVAVEQSRRFISYDMNRSFPGDQQSEEYETSRPTELLRFCKDFDVVLDFHNTHCPDNDCGFIGEKAESYLCNVAMTLGLNRVIVADYDCINKYAPNCLSVEISLDSRLCSATQWYEKIKKLSKQNPSSVQSIGQLDRYKFVYRMTLEDRDRLSLTERKLRAFYELESDLATELGVQSPAYPIFIGDRYTPYNYGGILNKY